MDGVPGNPYGWLVTVAVHRLLDELRGEQVGRRREDAVLSATPPAPETGRDDSLALPSLCCHPALSTPSQIALTLRAVGGLTTAQIATAFLVPGATMAQRISRAKQSVPGPAGRRSRAPALCLIFNEGYTATAGPDLAVPRLSARRSG